MLGGVQRAVADAVIGSELIYCVSIAVLSGKNSRTRFGVGVEELVRSRPAPLHRTRIQQTLNSSGGARSGENPAREPVGVDLHRAAEGDGF